jgi:hypothetical protein
MSSKLQRSFLVDNNLGRDKFRKRWDRSGLRELKKAEVPYADAEIQYNFWFSKWKVVLSKQKQLNGATSHRSTFIVYDDVDDVDADDVDDTDNATDGDILNDNDDDDAHDDSHDNNTNFNSNNTQ